MATIDGALRNRYALWENEKHRLESIMRITHVEAIPVGLPLAKPLIMAGRRYERSESLLVHVACEQAIEGCRAKPRPTRPMVSSCPRS